MESSTGGKEETEESRNALIAIQAALQSQKLSIELLGYCFERCVPSPAESLTNSQQTCLWNCAQRNVDTQFFILKRLEGMAKAFKAGSDSMK
ncbi:mitochondrial import inner membrane translocase subunit TIM13, putative (TIM13) [Babesia microti strain RI]|uniref:Mitochondrial import inner membrane translocase subunit n=1 Tax=Babesia microti (strain RI) TaxID=1133968 RepID=A0A1R4AAC0_BABMR|nr:mitochondrial import inner membrane translocase subunit TIM13, putative (TIM13) [Babesia microti strain RI]SJK85927.1 mitochondrial import inner membrane translocase subunit TIM13, putative (TIM13) [Babesia microti strain RI]|eukprot:XP_021338134.1 mitochondrial import inner membrane translocase subunit TIM13, putative (TIM13) [Babesia microti strain RI]